MSKFVTLFSSSSGNSACLLCGDTGILFDCGKSARTVLARLREAGIDPGCIRAICITHEHSDHISALEVLSGKLGCPVYASEPVAEYLVRHTPPRSELRVAESGGFEVGGIFVRPFPTPHDAAESTGYIFEHGGSRFGFATDLGFVPRDAAELLRGCEMVVLESNHDPHMLQAGPYPYSLKMRVAGPSGHLSNPDCAVFAADLVKSGTRTLVLAHLSEKNNMPELARQQTLSALRGLPACEVLVAPKEHMEHPVSFGEEKLCSLSG